jgi:hypothetical protein
MRAALRTLTATARTERLSLDTNGFFSSIKHFATSASRCDALTRRGATRVEPELELEAARAIDLLAYGVDGTTAITFPDVTRALREGNQATVDLAVARARTTLEHAAQLIAP